MKYEWRKKEKELYGAGRKPSLVIVPRQKYIMLSGRGNPNEMDFSNRVSALYSLAYAIKMAYKKTAVQSELSDFTVYPLEGTWKQKEEGALVKEKLEYTIMIRVPDFVSDDVVRSAFEQVKIKKPNPLFDEVGFESMEEGQCIEILHVGAFDDEPISFEKMEQFLSDNNLKQCSDYHREIYLNNASKVDSGKLKTILRYPAE